MRLASLIFLLVFCLSCRRYSPQPMSLVRDCTGTYLSVNGKDFHVCNTGKTDPFTDGQAVTASFCRIRTCNGAAADDIVCLMVHQNEGWIEVKEIH